MSVITLKKMSNDNYMSKKELIQFRIESEYKNRIKEIYIIYMGVSYENQDFTR